MSAETGSGVSADPTGLATWWIDDAVVERRQDALGRLAFAKSITDLIAKVGKASSSSTVIGITGPWGSGKTSTVNFALSGLDSKTWMVERLNPWALSGPDAVASEVFNAIAAALPPGPASDRLRQTVLKYGKYATAVVGAFVPGAGLATKVADLALGDAGQQPSLSRLALDAAGQLQDMDERILLFIDDIDRLQPQELLATFKAIRVLGRLPNVHYLIAYDQSTLLDVLKHTALANGDELRALAYLEKMVTVRLDQPPTRRAQIEELLSRRLNAALTDLNVLLDDDQTQRLAVEREGLLLELLREPRKVARFLAQVYGYLPLVDPSTIDVVDFLVLSLLRLTYPRLYDAVSADRRLLTEIRLDPGVGSSPGGAAEVDTDEARLDDWSSGAVVERCVGQAPSIGTRSAHQLIQHSLLRVFPVLLRDSDAARREEDERRRRRRASDPDYVDRYFDLNSEAESMPDHVIAGVLQEWASGQSNGPDGARVLRLIGPGHSHDVRQIASVLRRMRSGITDLSAQQCAAAFVVALPVLAHVQPTGSSASAPAGLLSALLLRAGETNGDAAVDLTRLRTGVADVLSAAGTAQATEADRRIYTALLASLRHSDWDPAARTASPVLDVIATLCLSMSWSILSVDLRAGDDALTLGSAHALAWLDRATNQATVDGRLATFANEGIGVDTLAARFVEIGTDPASGTRSIMGFDAERFRQRLGVLRIADRVDELAVAAELPISTDEDITWSNLRGVAARALLRDLNDLPVVTGALPELKRLETHAMVDLQNGFVPTGGSELPDVTFGAGFYLPIDGVELPDELVLTESNEDSFKDALEFIALGDWTDEAVQTWNIERPSLWTLTEAGNATWVEAGQTVLSAESEPAARMIGELRARLQIVDAGINRAIQFSVSLGLHMRELEQDRRYGGRRHNETPLPAALTLGEAVDLLAVLGRCGSTAAALYRSMFGTSSPPQWQTQLLIRSNGGLRDVIDLRGLERVGSSNRSIHQVTFRSDRIDNVDIDSAQQHPSDRMAARAALAQWLRTDGYRKLEPVFGAIAP
ncbi:P-loop NTPase fold protein [Nocardioides sp. C4-1]|uniref:KAP family P-loop NTPase fold protein n=1 Tax=Nocardioides sp. C4-1 TaxID=3151851 RepID=UPI003266A416